MKIFVGYGYNARDEKFISELVEPLIKAFGAEVVGGKEIHGQPLDEGVRKQIRRCDGLLGFTTRRDQMHNGHWTTHQWVKDELLQAKDAQPQIPFVEIRETDVDPQSGMLGNHARIEFDETAPHRCLLEVAKVLGNWQRGPKSFEFPLLLDDLSEFTSLLQSGKLTCVCRVLEEGVSEQQAEAKPASILSYQERSVVRTAKLPPDATVRVEIFYQEECLWHSHWEALKSRILRLQRSAIAATGLPRRMRTAVIRPTRKTVKPEPLR
jgi:hypothetical protein